MIQTGAPGASVRTPRAGHAVAAHLVTNDTFFSLGFQYVICMGEGYLCASVRVCVHACAGGRGCVLTVHQTGTPDAEILSTQRFQALSLLRNDVHLEDFMHLIIL